MYNPFPTALQLQAETATNALLAQQAADSEVFAQIIRQAQRCIAGLHFPLGSPAHGADLCDILATLADWQTPRDPEWLAEAAEDAVLAMLEGPREREEYADHGPTD